VFSVEMTDGRAANYALVLLLLLIALPTLAGWLAWLAS